MWAGKLVLISLAGVQCILYPPPVLELLESVPVVLIFKGNETHINDNTTDLIRVIPVPVVVISATTMKLLNHVRKDFLAIALFSDIPERVPQMVLSSMEYLERSRIIFVFRRSSSLFAKQYFFRQCFKMGLLNAIMVSFDPEQVDKVQILTYMPFENMKLVDLSNESSAAGLFPEKLRNFNKFPISTVFRSDYPRTFKQVDGNGNILIRGYLGRMLVNFIERNNGTLLDYRLHKYFRQETFEDLISSGKIDTAPHFEQPIPGQRIDCFSLGRMNAMVVVPQLSKVPRFLYLLKPFDWTLWIALAVFLFYASVVEYLIGSLIWKRFALSEAFTNVYLGMLFQGIKRSAFSRWQFSIIHGQIILLGFMMVNFYLAQLSSYLTATLYEAPPQTYEEIRQSGLKIMARNKSLRLYLKSGVIPDEYKDLYVAAPLEVLSAHVFLLNTSYAYAILEDRVKLLKELQKDFRRSIFYPTKILISEVFGIRPTRRTWVMIEKLNQFASRLFDCGILLKWLKDAVTAGRYHIRNLDELEYIDRHSTAVPLNINHMTFCWYCLIFGLGFACVCFALEIVIHFYLGNH